MKPSASIIVASSWEEFDAQIEALAVVVEFENAAAEQEYEQADWRLHQRVCEALGIAGGAAQDSNLAYVVEDWFPTKTKFVEVDTQVFGRPQLQALQALLVGEFEDWRINVQVFRGFTSVQSAHIGGVNVYRNHVLLQKELSALVESGA